MTNSANYLTSLSKLFILSRDENEKNSLLKEAKFFMENLDSKKSPAQILKSIGVSYFGAVNSSQKMEKGKSENYDSYVIYLSPAKSSGVNVCRMASAGCISACLSQSGHAGIAERSFGPANAIAISRLKKTWLAVFNRKITEKIIGHELIRHSQKAKKKGNRFAARLNGTSDIFFGRVFKKFPEIQFYDYTKNVSFLKLSKGFKNWHVTFSFSGENDESVFNAIKEGFNVAFPVVGSKMEISDLISIGAGYSMDTTDLRFLDSNLNNFGILSVKKTKGTKDGIKKGFLLSIDRFKKIRKIASGSSMQTEAKLTKN